MSTDYWITYPSAYRNQLKPLLNQQMWLFGQDIVCPKGNLLYQYQFRHQRPETRGSSMYTHREAGRQVVLWGWGIWFGQTDLGAIFVNRFRARPRFSAEFNLAQPVHVEKALPPMQYRASSKPQAEIIRQMWSDLLRWIAKYEAWVLSECGPSWRKAALKPFPHAFTKPAQVAQLPTAWQTLSEQSTTLPIKSYTD